MKATQNYHNGHTKFEFGISDHCGNFVWPHTMEFAVHACMQIPRLPNRGPFMQEIVTEYLDPNNICMDPPVQNFLKYLDPLEIFYPTLKSNISII